MRETFSLSKNNFSKHVWNEIFKFILIHKGCHANHLSIFLFHTKFYILFQNHQNKESFWKYQHQTRKLLNSFISNNLSLNDWHIIIVENIFERKWTLYRKIVLSIQIFNVMKKTLLVILLQKSSSLTIKFQANR